jgi:hypothetical protein
MANGNTAVQTLTLQTAGGDADYTFLRDNPALEGYEEFLDKTGERVTEDTLRHVIEGEG